MYLSKLLLKAYGQFNSKEVALKDGVNLIYCENREKRRTFRDFIVSMLYGSFGRNLFAPKTGGWPCGHPPCGIGFGFVKECALN
jgi:uncharacterized protein YhaN